MSKIKIIRIIELKKMLKKVLMCNSEQNMIFTTCRIKLYIAVLKIKSSI